MSGSKKPGRMRSFLVSLIDVMGAFKAGLKKVVLRILSFTESARKVLEAIVDAITDFGKRLLTATADLALVAAQLLMFYIPSVVLFFIGWPISAISYAVVLTLVGLLWIPYDREVPTCLFDFFDTGFMRDRELLNRLVTVGKVRDKIESLLGADEPVLTPDLAAHHLDRVDGILKALNKRLRNVTTEDRGGVIESAAAALESYAARLEEYGKVRQGDDPAADGSATPGGEVEGLTEEIDGLIEAMAEIGPGSNICPAAVENADCIAVNSGMAAQSGNAGAPRSKIAGN